MQQLKRTPKSKYVRFRSQAMLSGTGPESAFVLRFRMASSLRLPMDGGSVPTSLLLGSKTAVTRHLGAPTASVQLSQRTPYHEHMDAAGASQFCELRHLAPVVATNRSARALRSAAESAAAVLGKPDSDQRDTARPLAFGS